MPRRVDQVDEEVVAVALAREPREVLVAHLVVQRDPRGLDRDAAVLLVLACVGQALVARGLHRDDAGGGDERVGEGGFSCGVFFWWGETRAGGGRSERKERKRSGLKKRERARRERKRQGREAREPSRCFPLFEAPSFALESRTQDLVEEQRKGGEARTKARSPRSSKEL